MISQLLLLEPRAFESASLPVACARDLFEFFYKMLTVGFEPELGSRFERFRGFLLQSASRTALASPERKRKRRGERYRKSVFFQEYVVEQMPRLLSEYKDRLCGALSNVSPINFRKGQNLNMLVLLDSEYVERRFEQFGAERAAGSGRRLRAPQALCQASCQALCQSAECPAEDGAEGATGGYEASSGSGSKSRARRPRNLSKFEKYYALKHLQVYLARKGSLIFPFDQSLGCEHGSDVFVLSEEKSQRAPGEQPPGDAKRKRPARKKKNFVLDIVKKSLTAARRTEDGGARATSPRRESRSLPAQKLSSLSASGRGKFLQREFQKFLSCSGEANSRLIGEP